MKGDLYYLDNKTGKKRYIGNIYQDENLARWFKQKQDEGYSVEQINTELSKYAQEQGNIGAETTPNNLDYLKQQTRDYIQKQQEQGLPLSIAPSQEEVKPQGQPYFSPEKGLTQDYTLENKDYLGNAVRGLYYGFNEGLINTYNLANKVRKSKFNQYLNKTNPLGNLTQKEVDYLDKEFIQPKIEEINKQIAEYNLKAQAGGDKYALESRITQSLGILIPAVMTDIGLGNIGLSLANSTKLAPLINKIGSFAVGGGIRGFIQGYEGKDIKDRILNGITSALENATINKLYEINPLKEGIQSRAFNVVKFPAIGILSEVYNKAKEGKPITRDDILQSGLEGLITGGILEGLGLLSEDGKIKDVEKAKEIYDEVKESDIAEELVIDSKIREINDRVNEIVDKTLVNETPEAREEIKQKVYNELTKEYIENDINGRLREILKPYENISEAQDIYTGLNRIEEFRNRLEREKINPDIFYKVVNDLGLSPEEYLNKLEENKQIEERKNIIANRRNELISKTLEENKSKELNIKELFNQVKNTEDTRELFNILKEIQDKKQYNKNLIGLNELEKLVKNKIDVNLKNEIRGKVGLEKKGNIDYDKLDFILNKPNEEDLIKQVKGKDVLPTPEEMLNKGEEEDKNRPVLDLDNYFNKVKQTDNPKDLFNLLSEIKKIDKKGLYNKDIADLDRLEDVIKKKIKKMEDIKRNEKTKQKARKGNRYNNDNEEVINESSRQKQGKVSDETMINVLKYRFSKGLTDADIKQIKERYPEEVIKKALDKMPDNIKEKYSNVFGKGEKLVKDLTDDEWKKELRIKKNEEIFNKWYKEAKLKKVSLDDLKKEDIKKLPYHIGRYRAYTILKYHKVDVKKIPYNMLLSLFKFNFIKDLNNVEIAKYKEKILREGDINLELFKEVSNKIPNKLYKEIIDRLNLKDLIKLYKIMPREDIKNRIIYLTIKKEYKNKRLKNKEEIKNKRNEIKEKIIKIRNKIKKIEYKLNKRQKEKRLNDLISKLQQVKSLKELENILKEYKNNFFDVKYTTNKLKEIYKISKNKGRNLEKYLTKDIVLRDKDYITNKLYVFKVKNIKDYLNKTKQNDFIKDFIDKSKEIKNYFNLDVDKINKEKWYTVLKEKNNDLILKIGNNYYNAKFLIPLYKYLNKEYGDIKIGIHDNGLLYFKSKNDIVGLLAPMQNDDNTIKSYIDLTPKDTSKTTKKQQQQYLRQIEYNKDEINYVPDEKEYAKAVYKHTKEQYLKRVKPQSKNPYFLLSEKGRKRLKSQKAIIDGKVFNSNKPIYAPDIKELYKKVVGTRYYSEKLRNDILGNYRSNYASIQLSNANDIEVIAHETGHYLAYTKQGIKDFIKENANEIKPYSYTDDKNLIVSEGFAELFRAYMTNSGLIDKELYTKLDNALKENLTAKEYKYLKETQRQSHLYLTQGVENFNKANIDKEKNLKDIVMDYFANIGENLEKAKDNFISNFIDITYPLDKINEIKNIDKIKDKDNPYILFRHAIGHAESTLEAITFYGSAKKDAKTGDFIFTGKGLRDVFKDLYKDNKNRKEVLNDFYLYLLLKQSIQERRKGRKTPFIDQEEMLEKLENKYPHFKDVAKEWYAFRERMLDLMVSTNLITEKAKELMLKENPYYVPQHRVMSYDEVKNGNSLARRSEEGSLRQYRGVDNLFHQLSKEVYFSLLADAKTNLVKRLIGEGEILTIINKKTKAYEVAINQQAGKILAFLEERGMSISEDGDIVRQGEGKEAEKPLEKIIELLEEDPSKLLFFSFGHKPVSIDGNYVIPIIENNKIQYYQINKDNNIGKGIINMLNSLEAKPIESKWYDMVIGIKNFVSSSIVLRLVFMMKNIIRDTLTAGIFTKTGFIPVIDSFKGLKHIIKQSQEYKEALLNGAFYGTLNEMAGKEARGKMILTDRGYSGITAKLNRIGAFSEMSSRMGEYLRAVKQGINKRNASYLASDITVDFSIRANSQVSNVIRMTAFLPAFKNSMYKMGKEFLSKEYASVLKKGITWIGIPSLLIYLNNEKHRKRWLNLTIAQKTLYANFLTKTNTYNIPMPHELGYFFSKVPIAMLEIIRGDNEQAYKILKEGLLTFFTQEVIPTAIKPLYSLATNKNFMGYPIVPQRIQKLPKKFQYNSYTPMFYRWLGSKINQSPIKIQYLFERYFNGIADIVNLITPLYFWDKSKYGEKPFQIENLKQKTYEKVYKMANWGQSYYKSEYFKIINDYINAKETYRQFKDLDKLNKQQKVLLAHKKEMEKVIKYFKKYWIAQKYIYYNKNMTAEEKQKELRELWQKRNEDMKSFYKYVRGLYKQYDIKGGL